MTTTQPPFFKNALACIMAGVIGAIVTSRIGHRYLPFIPFMVIIALSVIILLASIIYAFIWKAKAAKGSIDNTATKSFWESVTRYFIALDMFMFGLGKIFHVQFRMPLGMLDNPFSDIDNQMLLWAFFGKYYSYTVIIAGLQITSALLLSFRKTHLLGLFFLLPILLNIVLLNYYYDFGPGVGSYTILLTLATVYLLLLDYPRLVEFFFVAKGQLPAVNFKSNWQKNVVRYSVIYIPVLLIAINKFPLFYPEYTGKYLVKNLEINGKQVPPPVSSKDSVLTKVYIDKDDNDFVLDYNDYRRRLIGSYNFDKQKNQFTVVWRYPKIQHDTLVATLLPGGNAGEKVLSGRMGMEVFKMDLMKAK